MIKQSVKSLELILPKTFPELLLSRSCHGLEAFKSPFCFCSQLFHRQRLVPYPWVCLCSSKRSKQRSSLKFNKKSSRLMNLSNFMQKMLPSFLLRLTSNSRLIPMGIVSKAPQSRMQIPLTFSWTCVLLYTFLGGRFSVVKAFQAASQTHLASVKRCGQLAKINASPLSCANPIYCNYPCKKMIWLFFKDLQSCFMIFLQHFMPVVGFFFPSHLAP